jgi:cell division protein FtsB
VRWLVWTVLALLIAVQWPLWFGKGGWLRVWELQRAVAAQRERNAGLVARNGVLAAEVRSLKEGREAIEERARHELHMTRSDEILFQFVRPDADRAGPAAARTNADATGSGTRSSVAASEGPSAESNGLRAPAGGGRPPPNPSATGR